MYNFDYVIDDMKREDWSQVRAIYGEGLATGLAAFMLSPPRWQPSKHILLVQSQV